MPPPIQGIFPGVLERAYRRELQNLVAKRAVSRLWSKDISLWPIAEHQAAAAFSTLRWLDLPDQLGPLMARVLARAADIEPSGFEDVVFIAVAEANMAADTVLRLPGARLGKRSFLLDTVDPDTLNSLEQRIRLDRALFIFASKSGKSIETHSLLLYFLQKLKLLGVEDPGQHFVALAEDDSYLAQLARSYAFVDAFFDPPGILGRFSALIHFNFFLAALGHFDPQDLLAHANSMRDACGPSAPEGDNPALALAALLAAAEMEGLHRLVVIGPPSLEPFAFRIARLIGACTGKEGRGILPIVECPPVDFSVLQRKTLAAVLKTGNNEAAQPDRLLEQLRAAGVPHVDIELNGPQNLAAELFKWELGAALACVQLRLNPFEGPEIRETRSSTTQILDRIAARQQVPSTTIRVKEGDVELFAERETRQQISTLSMTEALRSFFALRNPESYLALIAFHGLTQETEEKLQNLRKRLESGLGLPVLTSSAPRYLHGLAQACKDGPPGGLFILLTAHSASDVSVPGAGYSFGQLQLAMALAEFESLGRNERPVIRLHLARGAEQGLAQLEGVLASALGK